MARTSLLALLWTCLQLTSSDGAQASFSAPVTMLTAVNTTKPGCQRRCGNLTIPYPFGLSKACAMGDAYVVDCYKEDSGVLTPHFLGSTTQILGISETQMTVTAGGPVAETCDSKAIGNPWGGIEFSGLPYALSSTGNILRVIGCHHYGLIDAQTAAGRQVFSCVALCTEETDLFNQRCAGVGCCQVALPKGLQTFNASLELINYNTNISPGGCSYMFLMKKLSLDFHGAVDFQGSDFVDQFYNVPIVLDWFVPNESCTYAWQNSSSYACKKNTICVDVKKALDVTGYRCKCRPGYEGNPDLSLGCTDINECAGNPCDRICENVPGGFKCHCPSGYHGDGRKNGSGCHKRSFGLAFILGNCAGLGSIMFLICGYWAYLTAIKRKAIKQRAKNFKRNGGLLLQQQMTSKENMTEEIRLFTANELAKATDQFNEDRVLGRGGQGTVYKGMLSDGNLVAVKKHKIGDQTQLKGFTNEIAILSEINHRNIVKLLGCCLETEVPLLVYEFVLNGTLSKYIHNSQEDFPITWEMRLQIALDLAGALTYLHSSSSKPIFHRDIKASNILLDAKYQAKLSDFGTSRFVDLDQTHLTTRVQGTFGYLDPEYFRSSQYTEKSDVYSFGVVLVELLTGKKAVVKSDSDYSRSLASWFLSSMENSELFDILAPRVVNGAPKETILTIAKLARQSLKMDGRERPTMRQVALVLEAVSHNPDAPLSFFKSSLDDENVDRPLGDLTCFLSLDNVECST